MHALGLHTWPKRIRWREWYRFCLQQARRPRHFQECLIRCRWLSQDTEKTHSRTHEAKSFGYRLDAIPTAA